jgi:hypothetical protein
MKRTKTKPRRRAAPHHKVIGFARLLERKKIMLGGEPMSISVAELEPMCPAPEGRRRIKRHERMIGIELQSASARLHFSLRRRPRVRLDGDRLLLGELQLRFSGAGVVDVNGKRHRLFAAGSSASLEFAEDGTLIGLLS